MWWIIDNLQKFKKARKTVEPNTNHPKIDMGQKSIFKGKVKEIVENLQNKEIKAGEAISSIAGLWNK